jgi:hypothetical protein
VLGVKFTWINLIFSSHYLKACLDALNVAVPKFQEDPSVFVGMEAAVREVVWATHDSC